MTSASNNSSGRTQNLLKYFGIFMVLVYFGVGLALLLLPQNSTVLNKTTRLILGIALIAYSIFRTWRVFKSYKNETPS